MISVHRHLTQPPNLLPIAAGLPDSFLNLVHLDDCFAFQIQAQLPLKEDRDASDPLKIDWRAVTQSHLGSSISNLCRANSHLGVIYHSISYSLDHFENYHLRHSTL